MKKTIEEVFTEGVPWFKRWFDSPHYHKLYSKRDEKEAQNFIDELMIELQPEKRSSIIDVGCGAGRHSKYLASKGFDVTGIDTAFSSIQLAKPYQSALLRFFQHDMRTPFGKDRFDYVFNFFTSFGYFKSQHEHYQVIKNMADAIKPGGTVVIDYLNVAYAEDHLVEAEEKEIDGIAYHITRWMDETHFYKKIVIDNISVKEPFEYVEQVAKFTTSYFTIMLERQDLKIEEVYGDYQLNDYDSKKSPRLIMIAKKA